MLVGTTEVIPHNLNPVWKALSISLRADSMVTVKCWDEDKLTSDDIVGEAEVCVCMCV